MILSRVCGFDCHPNGPNCNGYCVNKAKAPATYDSPDDKQITVRSCARCGNDHEKLHFRRLTNPPKDEWQWFALCPENKQPIMLALMEEPPVKEVETEKFEKVLDTAELVAKYDRLHERYSEVGEVLLKTWEKLLTLFPENQNTPIPDLIALARLQKFFTDKTPTGLNPGIERLIEQYEIQSQSLRDADALLEMLRAEQDNALEQIKQACTNFEAPCTLQEAIAALIEDRDSVLGELDLRDMEILDLKNDITISDLRHKV